MTTDHAALAAAVLPEPALLIGDELVTKTSSGHFDRVDPSTGELLGRIPIAGQEEVDRAVAAAKAAFPAWRRVPADRRRQLMFAIAQALRDHEDELKQIIALETGTPLAVNRLAMAIDQFEYYGGWSDKFEGELITSYPDRAFDYVAYEPYGVIGALITWNGPVINASMKIAPAIAAGNTVVVKSPELGPYAVVRFGQILIEAGLPAGVVNIVSGGPETGEAIIRHPDIRKVSFTGGPAIAQKVMGVAAESLTPVCLELGGKSANIVFEDADLEKAGQMAALMSTIASSGQGCLYPTRLLVQDTVYDEVLERVRAVAESPVIGDPLDATVMMGPVISQGAVDRILGYVEGARASSARLVTGGDRIGGDLGRGYFVKPTVFADVDHTSTLAQEEVFGPVLAAMPFTTEGEALAKANNTRYGLAAYIHTRDLARAHRVAGELEAGYIGVNAFPAMTASAPFGGTKYSGFGREGGRAGIEEFVHHKNVYIPLG
ncbi:aldehyde dehydrogenase family protein [Actinomadura sp. LD22]|uniref:Aldehyde dehydrogenase family protein n=1 Tax=Actinomadura physcomitrii TaxID=2650748 RepID=A0A6I4M6X0_9ACTN|nr:aldehyde dehydrogenase family protein [Actinomadura physcomitrii]MVZ99906.1 aldehyde dehydrogenase family protein [Actinomadura physcomitrii]